MGKRDLRRRFLSFSLAVCMIFTLFPVRTRATVYEGDCGAAVRWTFDDETGVLSITGTGDMDDYTSGYNTPWTDYRSSITSVQIGEGVTHVGDYAFQQCYSLTDVSLPSTLTSVGNYAFETCGCLTNVNFPSSLESIGSYAFYNCTALTSVAIPAGVKSIGEWAFYYCNSLSSLTFAEGLESIGNYAFYYCTVLTSVTIPASVKSLGGCAFYYCTSLSSVTLSEGLESIGENAFAECYNLSSMTVPASVTEIGGSAFPSSLTPTVYFDTYAWRYCISNNISCNVTGGDGKTYTAAGECGEGVYWKLDSDGKLTVSGNGAMSDCDSYSSGSWRDRSNDIKTVEIQSGVTAVGNCAFYSYYYSYPNLTAVSLPNTLTSIGAYAFQCCAALASVTIPDSVTSIGQAAFGACNALTSVTIPSGVEQIESDAFGNCEKLTLTVTDRTPGYGYALRENIPFKLAGGDTVYSHDAGGECGTGVYWTLDGGALTVFGSGAMRDYSTDYENRAPWVDWRESITAVEIQSGVTSVGNYAFYDGYNGYSYPNLSAISLADSVTKVGDYAFCNCDALKSIVIPDSVTAIGNNAFDNCDALSNVTFPANLVSIGDYAFYYCPKLTSVTLPDKLASIGAYAFYDCNGLVSVVLPDSVTAIGNNAFNSCDALASLTLSKNLVSIGEGAFCYCYALRSLTLPDKVSTIGAYAFQGCNRLTALTIPATVKTIGEGAFRDCGDILLTVTENSGGHTYALSDGVPFKLAGGASDAVRVGGSCGTNVSWVLDWKTGLLEITGSGDMTSYPWSSYNNKIKTVTIGSGVTSICDYAFQYCQSLTSVTLPDTLTSIGYRSFYNCWLTSVEIPGNVSSIGSYAFQDCYELVSVTLPANLKKIEPDTFYNCGKLESVTIPNGMQSIDREAFYSCNALKSVTIPASVVSIDDSAFSGCPQLVLTVTEDSEAHNYAVRNNVSFRFVGTDTVYHRGTCGAELDDDVIWILDSNGLMTVSGSGDMRDFNGGDTPWNDFREQIKSVSVGSGVTSIGSCAFYDCDALESVTLPASVTFIDYNAFSDCAKLVLTVTENDAAYTCALRDGVRFRFAGADTTYRGGYCGPDSSSDSVVWLLDSNGLMTIKGSGAMRAFSWDGETPWYNLREQIKSVSVDSGVTSVGSYAFYDCNALASVTIADSVTSIGYQAFNSCDALEAVTVPAAVKEIGEIAFGDCGNLVLTVTNGSTAHNYAVSNLICYRFAGSDTVYRASGLWGAAASQAWTLESNGILTISGTGAIADYANGDATKWASVRGYIDMVVVKDGVTKVGSYAFANCNNLEKVFLPASVKTIGQRAFSDNQNLVSVSLEEGLNSIGASAFYDCPKLLALTVPESVTSIGSDAFNTYYYYYDTPFRLNVYSGSDAMTYAETNSIPHTVITRGTAQVSGVTLDESSLMLMPGQSVLLSASVQPDDAQNKKVTWSSDNPAVASVDELGIVKAISDGSAKISVTTEDGGKTAFCTVSVVSQIPVSTIVLSVSKKALTVGEGFDLTASVYPENASDKNVTWSTSDDNITSINENYYGYGSNTVWVTKNDPGTAVITASSADGSIVAQCEILDSLDVTGVRIEQKSVVLKQGGKAQLSATVLPEGANNDKVSWSCSDSDIAEVAEDGTVTGRNKGKATIIATTDEGGFRAVCLVEVTNEVTNVEGITLNRDKIPSLEFGTSMQLVATITPDDATNQAITWTSSAPEVVAVSDNGVVTALETGKTAVITAMTDDGGRTASCVVTVSDSRTPTDLRVYAPDSLTAVKGSPLNLAGVLVEAVYGNITEYVSDYSVYDYNRDRVGAQTVTVSYKGKTATLDVRVIERHAEYVFIAQSPDKREYAIGEELDLSGLILQAEYNDQTLETIKDTSQMTPVGFRSDVAGTYPVTVTWNGLSVAFYVTILAASAEPVSLTAPKMNISGYPGGKRVELSAVSGAEIRYESDESIEVSSASPLYQGPILCTGTTTVIKAAAFLNGEQSAVTVSRVFVDQVQPIVASHDSGTQLPAGTLVTLRTPTDGAVIRYTTDGTEPTTDSPLYSSGVLVNADMTLKAVAMLDGARNSKTFTATYTAARRTDTQSAATISIGSVTSRAGERASAPVYLFTEGDQKVTFFRFTISFDRRAFEFASVSPAEGISASNLMVSSGANSGSVTVMYDAPDGNAMESGEAFTLTLRARDSSEDGEYLVSLSAEEGITIKTGDTRPLVSPTPGVITLSGSHNSQLTGEISLQDGNGNAIDALQDGQDQINVSFALDPYTPDAAQSNGALTAMADVYLVLYDDEGYMLDIQTWNIELKNVWLAFSQVKQVPPEIKGKIDKIKIMILSEDMTPIMAASEL
ncbi:MAG: leucine-rich repeat protein [Oscillospiraceae bacterium]|nr:leucine-rich repeat protein [Oscillospiraceae bacterium]